MPKSDFETLYERFKNDRLSRDQFRRVTAAETATGYECELHGAADVPADVVRDPMPEKKAKYPVWLCRDCWLELPADQASVER